MADKQKPAREVSMVAPKGAKVTVSEHDVDMYLSKRYTLADGESRPETNDKQGPAKATGVTTTQTAKK